jgi:hypothetical protein
VLAHDEEPERAVSILLVLAALAFVGLVAVTLHGVLWAGHTHASAPARVTKCTAKLDLPAIPIKLTAQQEPPPPMTAATWSGTCLAGEHGWPDMPISLDLEFSPDDHVRATGTLEFSGRRTRAELHGALWNDRINLRGHMTEIGGLGTVWKIELRARSEQSGRIVGSLIEIWPDSTPGQARMCSFDWAP